MTTTKSGAKRGRPKNSMIPGLILAGKMSENPRYHCFYCERTFPRKKGLNAHIRTHTNERSYMCSYPGCHSVFIQSGQLKTHLRRHTLEKPFGCPETGCEQRYSHSSRSCSKHPGSKLIRDGKETISIEKIMLRENLTEKQIKWIEEYKENKGKPAKRRILGTPNGGKCIGASSSSPSSPATSGISEASCSSSSLSSLGISEASSSSTSDISEASYSLSSPSTSDTSGHISCLEASAFQTKMEEEKMENSGPYLFNLHEPEDLEAALILCSFSEKQRNELPRKNPDRIFRRFSLSQTV